MRNRRVRNRPETLADGVVHYVEDAEPSACDEVVVHGVQVPALVGERHRRRGRPYANGAPSSLPAPEGLPFSVVETLGLLAVVRDAVAMQQDVRPSTVESPALLHQLTQTRSIGSPSSARHDRYRILVWSAPTAAHARRSLIPTLPGDA